MDGTIQGIDWTLRLPEDLIHDILSRLFTKEAARTSVLSKTWLRARSTDPNLVFNESYFTKEPLFKSSDASFKDKYDPKIQENRERFLNYVDKTMLRYDRERIAIEKFRLDITSVDEKWDSIVGNWIEILVQNKVKELELYLSECDFLGSILNKHMCDGTLKFYSLRRLGLRKVCINEEEIQKIICCCPLIQELRLLDCRGLKKLQVANLHYLNLVTVYYLEEVEISAPNLQSFLYSVHDDRPWMFNIYTSPHLKELRLRRLGITDKMFHDLMPKFHFLKKLELRCCLKLKRINISSHSLEHISLKLCRRLEEARIDCPNLLSFKYDRFRVSLSLSFTSAPRLWKLSVNLLETITNPAFFVMFRTIVTGLNQSVALEFNLFHWPEKKMSEMKKLKGMPFFEQVPVVEYLKLKLFTDLRLCYESLLDCLFWTCHPRKVFLKSGGKLTKTLIEKLCEMLMEREEDPHCCSSGNGKCWRHFLKDVEFGSFELKTKVERALPWKTLLDFLPFLGENQGVYFKLKW